MKILKHFFAFAFMLLLITLNVAAQNDFNYNCYSIVVGKGASADGSVFLAHNEDNSGEPFIDLHKVPRIKHAAGEKQALFFGDSINEVNETYAYFWLTVSQYNADQFINEWGVAITSDGSRSKETNAKGTIEQSLRRIVIERSKSAREAVKIGGALVEKYGYAGSGRIYSIADPNEGWILEVVNGKHWIARRVPDDEVVLIPNYYVIDYVDLKDTLNYLSSPDIIDYAISKGWYNPATDKSFNFRKAYAHNESLGAVYNVARKWAALNVLSEKQYTYRDEFPFSFKPKHKISIQDLMQILENHYENTELEMLPKYSPHYNSTTMRICSSSNNYGDVIQLRNWLPVDIGTVMWLAPKYPCIQPYIPWYYGINKISSLYEDEDYPKAIKHFINKEKDYKKLYPNHGYWTFYDFAEEVDKNYAKHSDLIEAIKIRKHDFEENVFKTVNSKEAEIITLYKLNSDKAKQMLTELSNNFAEAALTDTKKKMTELKHK